MHSSPLRVALHTFCGRRPVSPWRAHVGAPLITVRVRGRLRQVLGVYSYFLETLEDVGDEVVNGKLQAANSRPCRRVARDIDIFLYQVSYLTSAPSNAAGTRLDATALANENRELRESMAHLRSKYEDLMAYMKERCYADDGAAAA